MRGACACACTAAWLPLLAWLLAANPRRCTLPARAVLRVPGGGRRAEAHQHARAVVPLGLPAVDPRGGAGGGLPQAWRRAGPSAGMRRHSEPTACRDALGRRHNQPLACPPRPSPAPAADCDGRGGAGAGGGGAVHPQGALGPAVLRVPAAHGRQDPVRVVLHGLPPAVRARGRWGRRGGRRGRPPARPCGAGQEGQAKQEGLSSARETPPCGAAKGKEARLPPT